MDKLEKLSVSADIARGLTNHVMQLKAEIASKFLELGKTFKEIRDKKWYTYEDYNSFGAYVAQLGFGYSTVRSYIRIYELYVERLKRPRAELQEATWGQLQIINPVVEQDPDEWIEKAKVLSRGDLINEVREAQGKEPMPEIRGRAGDSDTIGQRYLDYVDDSPCCVCGKRPIQRAHFPSVKLRAAEPWHVIPLCADCHIGSQHWEGINTFLSRNKRRIFSWFYTLIGRLYDEIEKDR